MNTGKQTPKTRSGNDNKPPQNRKISNMQSLCKNCTTVLGRSQKTDTTLLGSATLRCINGCKFPRPLWRKWWYLTRINLKTLRRRVLQMVDEPEPRSGISTTSGARGSIDMLRCQPSLPVRSSTVNSKGSGRAELLQAVLTGDQRRRQFINLMSQSLSGSTLTNCAHWRGKRVHKSTHFWGSASNSGSSSNFLGVARFKAVTSPTLA